METNKCTFCKAKDYCDVVTSSMKLCNENDNADYLITFFNPDTEKEAIICTSEEEKDNWINIYTKLGMEPISIENFKTGEVKRWKEKISKEKRI